MIPQNIPLTSEGFFYFPNSLYTINMKDKRFKYCPTCGVTFPRTAEHFTRDCTRPDGLHWCCKKCELNKAKNKRPYTLKRFLSGKGERFTESGRIRCQAVSRTRLKIIRKKLGKKVTPNRVFRDVQCKKTAVPGYYMCYFHLRRYKERYEYKGIEEMKNDVTKFLTANMADKFNMAHTDTELFNQRQNIALLTARNYELLEDGKSSALSNRENLKALQKAVQQIRDGDVQASCRTIENVVNSLTSKKEAWDEFRKNAETIKDLSNAEMNRRKEMRLYLTNEQVMTKMNEFMEKMMNAVEKTVDDPQIIDGVYTQVMGVYRESVGTPGHSILPENTD